MEKFAVDLDKVLDDFELEEDQAEQFMKHTDKSDSSGNIDAFREHHTGLIDLIKTQPPILSFSEPCALSSIDKPAEVNEPPPTSQDVPDARKEEVIKDAEPSESKPTEVAPAPAETSEHSNLNELLLDLTEPLEVAVPNGNIEVPGAAKPEISTLLDSSFTEDIVSQPTLLTDIIQNGAFNPTQTDGLTEDELESYLAQLEEEDQVDLVSTLPVLTDPPSAHQTTGDTPPTCLAEELQEATGLEKDTAAAFVEDLPEELASLDLQNTLEVDEVIEGSSECESSLSEADTAEIQAETDDDLPPLIDDPTIQPPVSEELVAVEDVLTPEEVLAVEAALAAEAQLDAMAASSATPQEYPVEESQDPVGQPSTPPVAEDSEGSTVSAEPSAPQPPVEASAVEPEPYSSLSDEERLLGVLKPLWIPDEDAPICMNCSQRFTVLRRRHHCRACGRVLCSACCSNRARLEYMECKEARVCLPCLQILQKVEAYKKWGGLAESGHYRGGAESSSQSSGDSTPASSPSPHLPKPPAARVNPNNPAEYCSTVPPPLQAAAMALPAPTVMVPVGVLKKDGSSSNHSRTRSEPKQVIFSDGIRPGGDLTELDAWRTPGAEGQASHRPVPRRHAPKAVTVVPPTAQANSSTKKLKMLSPNLPPILDGPDSTEQLSQILADPAAAPVSFALQSTSHPGGGPDPHLLMVRVKLLQLDCCVRRKCWSFTTSGMRWVAQDEMVILLEQETITVEGEGSCAESLPPADVFHHLLSIYEDAVNKHHIITNLGHTVTPGTFLGSTEHGGFLFFRVTFQCVQQLVLPQTPYLFGVLLQRWEIPWAKVFPLRLLLRLGAEFRYYPCPLFSVRQRKPVFGEVGHTIINLLADMRNFNYSLPAVPGLVVHMEERETNILMPKSRYQQVCKALAQSNDHVISLAASFSPLADAHLVCLQSDDGSYQTQAINIHTRPRKVTGASFLVLNGALKSSSGLSGRSSIVEDGVMVQLLPDMLESLKQALIRMEDYTIQCGKVTDQQPEETVTLKWVDQEPSPINAGVTSPIDGRSLSGVPSIRVTQPRDYKGEGHRLLRWTELFIIQVSESSRSGSRSEDNGDVTRFAEGVAKATSVALAVKLAQLDPHTLVGLRVSLDGDSVEYQAGADQKPVPSACIEQLDSSLIPLLHRESAAQTLSCVMELWFQIWHP